MLLVAALLLAVLAGEASACSSSGGRHHVAPYDRVVEVNGRRRSLLSFRGRRCGTEPPSPQLLSSLEYRHTVFAAKERAAAAGKKADGSPVVYRIPTFVHVVVSSDGTKMGDVPQATVDRQIAALNEAYASASAESGLRFEFDVQSVTRTQGPDMCDQGNEAKVKQQLRKGAANALNLYITDLSACGLLGYSSWPWDLGKNGVTADGVVIHYDTLPGGQYKPYNLGRTTIHEIGHWLGLYHTFQSGCGGSGDAVDDTPACAGPSEGCPTDKDTCPQPGSDPVRNFMDYSDDLCMRAFSAGQHQRVEQMWKQYRLATR